MTLQAHYIHRRIIWSCFLRKSFRKEINITWIVVVCRDYNAKKAQLQYLQRKALDKNPDEFYYHMVNSEVKDGVHFDKKKDAVLTAEQVKLMQTQDHRYISSRHVIETKKIKSLQSNLHQLNSDHPNQHTFFVDDEKELKKFSLAKRLDTVAPLLHRRYNRVRKGDLSSFQKLTKDSAAIKNVATLRHKAYKELEQREIRKKKLATVERKIEIKKCLQVLVLLVSVCRFSFA